VKRILLQTFQSFPYTFVLQDIIPPISGTLAYWAVRTPAEVVKIKCQTGQSLNAFEALQTSLAEGGVAGLWKRYTIMLQLDIPFQISNFILYDSMVNLGLENAFGSLLVGRLVVGTISGMISAAITTPLDVAKTRMVMRSKAQQTSTPVAQYALTPAPVPVDALVKKNVSQSILLAAGGSGAGLDDPESEPQITQSHSLDPAIHLPGGLKTSAVAPQPTSDPGNNALAEIMNIMKEDGLGALFSGVVPRVLQVGISNGIRFAGYGTTRTEIIRRAFERQL
jgi:hypothetical protein